MVPNQAREYTSSLESSAASTSCFLCNYIPRAPTFLIHQGFRAPAEGRSRSGQSFRAFRHSINHIYSQQAQPDIWPSIILIPVMLIPNKWVPLSRSPRILRDDEIRSKAEDFWIGLRLDCFVVKGDIPDPGCSILWLTKIGYRNEELLAGGVGAEKSDKIVGWNRLILE